MKTKEVPRLLKTLGWRVYTDEVGDRVANYFMPDRIVDIIYGIRGQTGDRELVAMLSVSTEAFSHACSEICAEGARYSPLVRAWEGPARAAPVISEDHVRELSDEAISWAQEQDLDAGLRELAALPTDAPGARPVWHLAALAVMGHIDRLKSYQASFEAGDRLGFVPYITKDYIDRAVSLAETRIGS